MKADGSRVASAGFRSALVRTRDQSVLHCCFTRRWNDTAHDGDFVRSIHAPFNDPRQRAGRPLTVTLDWLVPDFAAEAAGKRQRVRDLLTDAAAEVVVIRDTPTVRFRECKVCSRWSIG